jgi:D-alanyl-D-alanine carboxypeptidase
MSQSGPARTAARRRPSTVLAVLVIVSAALIGFLIDRSATSGNDASAMPTVTFGTPPPPATPSGSFAPGPPDRLPRDQQGALGEADGVVPDGVTVFDDEHPAVAKLDPVLLRALREAATDAARDGVTFEVDSGWRSPKYQEQLLRAAIAKYGSEEEAARWVATPETSAHVSGDAVDIGPWVATAWLSRHGATYGLCQIYRNEPWHYELRAAAVEGSCPRMFADPTHDPRMQQ